MKTKHILLLLLVSLTSNNLKAQDLTEMKIQGWQIGLGLGELPMDGSFKPSITVGYHFNDQFYVGTIYQFKDKISRGNHSINAKSAELEGLIQSSEDVNQRLLFQVRLTPIKNGPYLSGGIVYNGKDTETMYFDGRQRHIAGNDYSGNIIINQTRPAGWGMALGIGYQYNFKNGFSSGFEWTPAWAQYPSPTYKFSGNSSLDKSAQRELQNKMDEGFKSSITNTYKVFHFGIAYRFFN